MFGWHWKHLLTHPWIILEELWDRARWAWQRVYRGWDDRAIWSIDVWMIDHMLPIMEEYLDSGHFGISLEFFPDIADRVEFTREEELLAKRNRDEATMRIIKGLQAGRRMINMEYKKYTLEGYKTDKVIFEEGMNTLRDVFFTLWT